MIVQLILRSRMGARELESDEEEDGYFEIDREVINKYGKGALPPREKIEADKAKWEEEKRAKAEEEKKAKAEEEKKTKEAAEAATEKVDEDKKDEAKDESKAEDVKTEDDKKEDVKTESEDKKPDETKTDDKKDDTKIEEGVKPKDEKDKEEEKKEEIKKEEGPAKTATKPEVKPKEETPKKPLKPARLIEVEEYQVKFKNFSYLHCQWLTEEELTRGDKRAGQKIRRWQQKRLKSGNALDFCEDEAFNPDYVEVDRVLDFSEHTDPQTNVTTKHYLVKWRSLPYEDCTWELESDVDPIKIKDYERWKNPPPEECYYKKRPRPKEWKKWDESPAYKNNNKLRPYQLEGVNWLLFSWYNGRNCLLADEMGLVSISVMTVFFCEEIVLIANMFSG